MAYDKIIMGRLVGSGTTITEEYHLANGETKGKIPRLVSSFARVVSSLGDQGSALAPSAKRGVVGTVGVLFVGLVRGGVDLALTMGDGLDDEGGECPIHRGKLGLGRGRAQSFSHGPGTVAGFGEGRM